MTTRQRNKSSSGAAGGQGGAEHGSSPKAVAGGRKRLQFDVLEAEHPQGLTVQQVIDAVTADGEKLTEAAFRKYVQLGLLPQSTRVARRGRNRGSQGLYPVTIVRQIHRLREWMASGLTMDEILRDFLFLRGDIESLRRQLGRIEETARNATDDRAADLELHRALKRSTELGQELIAVLEEMETRLTIRARMDRAAI